MFRTQIKYNKKIMDNLNKMRVLIMLLLCKIFIRTNLLIKINKTYNNNTKILIERKISISIIPNSFKIKEGY